MEYNFKSLFDKSKEYTIHTDEPLNLYDEFIISIRKVDNDIKSYNDENIDCELQYFKRGTLNKMTIELDNSNFSGYYMMVETFKRRECLSMGEPLIIERVKPKNEFENVNLENAEQELKLAFEKYVTDNDIMNILFQCFLQGVSYGKNKTHL